MVNKIINFFIRLACSLRRVAMLCIYLKSITVIHVVEIIEFVLGVAFKIVPAEEIMLPHFLTHCVIGEVTFAGEIFRRACSHFLGEDMPNTTNGVSLNELPLNIVVKFIKIKYAFLGIAFPNVQVIMSCHWRIIVHLNYRHENKSAKW